VEAHPASANYRLSKFVRRNSLKISAAAAVVLALTIGLLLASYGLIKARREARLARAEAARSEQVSQFVKEMFSAGEPYRFDGHDAAVLREILDRASQHIGRLKDQPEVEAELSETMAAIYCETGPLQTAETMIGRALAIRRSLPGDQRLGIATCLHGRGLVAWRQGKLPEAERDFRDALALRQQALKQADPLISTSLMMLGGVLSTEGRISEAEAVLRQGLDLDKKRGEPGNLWALHFLGQVLERQGKYAESERVLRDAVEQAKRSKGADDVVVADTERFLAFTLHHAGRLTEAEDLLRHAIGIARAAPDPGRSLLLAWLLDEFAWVRQQQHDLPAAESAAAESLSILEKVDGPANIDAVRSRQRLISIFEKQGKSADAEAMCRKALALSQASTRP
jgi:serine/threonine-protein kinase